MQQSFLQSQEWEKLQEQLGRKIWRICGYLVIRHDLAGGFNYLYAPRLPELEDEFLQKVREVAFKEKSFFLKVDPIKNFQFPISNFQFHESHGLQPRKTIIIDLAKSEEELLGEMHPKTRYNIRLAEKRGVNVAKYHPFIAKDIMETFGELMEETARRDKFRLHPAEYYHKLLKIRGTRFENALFLAEYRGRALAAALVNYYEKSVTYLHGASSSFHRDMMAPHLVHWRAIQDAKKNGFLSYDLWGIDEKKWPGISRFKTGFGGNIVEYPQSIDIIFRPVWYRIYKLARKVF
ncbi:MAG: peptidoglycan bridge formation glycyltransferase FemA/FemB family protein [bacterium]|nr:peptidoglycan bridge formation glycyltransferase FemA/FemB family protein [bacterium]